MGAYPSPGLAKPIRVLMSANCVTFWFSGSQKKRENNQSMIGEGQKVALRSVIEFRHSNIKCKQ
jgi:hypothetical protein